MSGAELAAGLRDRGRGRPFPPLLGGWFARDLLRTPRAENRVAAAWAAHRVSLLYLFVLFTGTALDPALATLFA